jgi:hypothetical protein
MRYMNMPRKKEFTPVFIGLPPEMLEAAKAATQTGGVRVEDMESQKQRRWAFTGATPAIMREGAARIDKMM